MEKDFNTLSVLKKELQNYKKMRIPDGTVEKAYEYEEVVTRPLSTFDVNENISEDRLFLIEIGEGYSLVGYKLLVDYFNKKGKGLADIDSRITVDMLLGIYEGMRTGNGVVSVRFYKLESEEKVYIFNKIKRDTKVEILYRIVMNADSFKMPKWEDIWLERMGAKSEEEKIEFLSNTEPHLRKYTNEVLKKNSRCKFTIYDPACSTGEFLEYVKNSFPNCYTIGHDMDENMIKIAKNRVDESACFNAFDSPIASKTVDVLVLRFLNYAVVNRQEAEELFEKLIETITNDGLVICFGHTPVLLNACFFENCGFSILEKIGYDELTDSIFQYYLMKRQIADR